MPGHDIIVVGASAGGVEALSKLAETLPADLPAVILVTLHIPAHSASFMPRYSVAKARCRLCILKTVSGFRTGEYTLRPQIVICLLSAVTSAWFTGPARTAGARQLIPCSGR